jgi:hypothetical protein
MAGREVAEEGDRGAEADCECGAVRGIGIKATLDGSLPNILSVLQS